MHDSGIRPSRKRQRNDLALSTLRFQSHAGCVRLAPHHRERDWRVELRRVSGRRDLPNNFAVQSDFAAMQRHVAAEKPDAYELLVDMTERIDSRYGFLS